MLFLFGNFGIGFLGIRVLRFIVHFGGLRNISRSPFFTIISPFESYFSCKFTL